MNWQPIETAPKDGTHVLLYGRFTDLSGADARYIGLWFQGYTDRGWWVVSALPFHPTHWAPLPAPPTVDEGMLTDARFTPVAEHRATGSATQSSSSSLLSPVEGRPCVIERGSKQRCLYNTTGCSEHPAAVEGRQPFEKNGIQLHERVVCIDVPRLHGTVIHCALDLVRVRWDDGKTGDLVWDESVAYNAYRLQTIRVEGRPPGDEDTNEKGGLAVIRATNDGQV